jgi:hypothetical protein
MDSLQAAVTAAAGREPHNESFFGHCKWSHDRNPQERVDAIGAHGSTKLNHTFDGKNFLRIKQNRLLLLMLRRAASRRAAIRQQQIEQTKTLGELHRLQTMEKRRDLQKRKERAQMGREAVERDMPLPTKAEYEAVRKLARKKGESMQVWRERLIGKRVTQGPGKQTKAVWEAAAKEEEGMGVAEFADYTLELYSAIVFGRRYTGGECNTTSCADKTKKCKLGCSHPMHDSANHMPQHVAKLLGKNIPLPPGVAVPACDARVYGNITLGGKATGYDELTKRREVMHNNFFADCIKNPHKYSPVVQIPNPLNKEHLKGRKIEMRLKIDVKTIVGEVSAEAKERGYIIWCHEGIIEDVLEATTTSTKKFGITTKHAAAQILWDTEFKPSSTTQKESACVWTAHSIPTSTPRTPSS